MTCLWNSTEGYKTCKHLYHCTCAIIWIRLVLIFEQVWAKGGRGGSGRSGGSGRAGGRWRETRDWEGTSQAEAGSINSDEQFADIPGGVRLPPHAPLLCEQNQHFFNPIGMHLGWIWDGGAVKLCCRNTDRRNSTPRASWVSFGGGGIRERYVRAPAVSRLNAGGGTRGRGAYAGLLVSSVSKKLNAQINWPTRGAQLCHAFDLWGQPHVNAFHALW